MAKQSSTMKIAQAIARKIIAEQKLSDREKAIVQELGKTKEVIK